MAGWPPGTYQFNIDHRSGKPVFYTPYDGSNGGPFFEPQEAWDWMKAVDQRNANLKENYERTAAQVFVGQFPALNFVLGPHEGREAAFLYSASRLFGSSAFWWEKGLFSGKFHEINQLINYGEQEQLYEHKSHEQTVQDFPDTPVKQAVLKVIGRA